MILHTTKLGLLFTTLYYESEENIMTTWKRARGSSFHVYSYEKLNLPPSIKLIRSQPTVRIATSGKTDDELLAPYRKNYRNEIRHAEEEGYTYETITDEQSHEAYALYARFEKAQGRKPYPYSYFASLRTFIARNEGAVVSGVSCIDAQPVLKVFAIYSARPWMPDAQASLGFAGKKLIYDASRHARTEGYSYLDLAYIPKEDDTREGLSGIQAFKMGFGGETVDEYQYAYASPLLSVLRRIRSLLPL